MKFRPRFGLRTVMVGVVLTCVASALVASQLEKQRRHQHALTRLNGIGADIYSQGDNVIVTFSPPFFDCIDGCPPIHYYSSATDPVTKFHSRELKVLADVHELTFVNFEKTSVDDDAIAHLCEVETLTAVVLDGTDVTDRAVTQLTTLPNLKWLSLRKTKVSDEAVARLRSANPHLEIRR